MVIYRPFFRRASIGLWWAFLRLSWVNSGLKLAPAVQSQNEPTKADNMFIFRILKCKVAVLDSLVGSKMRPPPPGSQRGETSFLWQRHRQLCHVILTVVGKLFYLTNLHQQKINKNEGYLPQYNTHWKDPSNALSHSKRKRSYLQWLSVGLHTALYIA